MSTVADRPDVLVLGAGGALAAGWMRGLLAGITAATGVDFRDTELLLGTSAGAVLAADLLAGRAPQAPGDGGAAAIARAADEREPTDVPTGGQGDAADSATARLAGAAAALPRALRTLGGAAASRLAPYALAASRPPGALLRAGALQRIEPPRAALEALGRRIARDGLRFDGRLRIVCVERERGRRVVFGAPGAPRATVAAAVQASCSVPWVHRPVRIGAHEYVDGGLWSPTNLDAAPTGRDTRVLCLNPSGAAGPAPTSGALRLASRSAAALEALALRRRGAAVTVVSPDPSAATALQGGWGDGRGTDATDEVARAGFRQGLALAGAA